MEVNGQLRASVALHTGNDAPVTTEWTPEPVWTLWRIEKSLALAGYRTSIPRPSSLCRLTYANSRNMLKGWNTEYPELWFMRKK
jgi:hypothetical protein